MRRNEAVVAVLEVDGKGNLCDQMNSNPGIMVVSAVMYIHMSSTP
jgi:hypothetical protein